MGGEATGVAESQRARDLWAAITAGTGVHLTIAERLLITWNLDALIAVSRPAFHVTGHSLSLRALPAGFHSHLGIGVKFP